jgi:ADP-ribose pyrophosphatase YjhB (NUDIX family)
VSDRKEDRLYPDRPFVGVLAVVRRGARFLLARRSIPPGIGKWGFPGGMQELGETVNEATRRELMEETGIDAEPIASLTVLDAIRRDDDGRVKVHFALVCVLCQWRSGEGEPIEDAEAVGWFGAEEIAALDCFPKVEEVLGLAVARG